MILNNDLVSYGCPTQGVGIQVPGGWWLQAVDVSFLTQDLFQLTTGT